MASVTQRISKVQQPYGGYLPIKLFAKEKFDDGNTLNENENIHASLIGIAVDYLTRFLLGDTIDKAFNISCLGAANIGMLNKASVLKKNITGLDDLSIISACKLVGFDVCYRASKKSYKPIETINPDVDTIENIRIIVKRSILFWRKFGPIISSEITFEGGYTDTIDAGDGDFISADTLWDFKVSKSSPTSKHSLQVLVYYIMGLHSVHMQFKSITSIGIYNPRLNIAYICPISNISTEVITEIENNVICYGVTRCKSNANIPTGIKSKSSFCSRELTVAEICNNTGLKKNMIYGDIRSGKLKAYKKGNKYCVSITDYLEYVKRKKLEQKIRMGFAVVMAIICFLIMIFLFEGV